MHVITATPGDSTCGARSVPKVSFATDPLAKSKNKQIGQNHHYIHTLQSQDKLLCSAKI